MYKLGNLGFIAHPRTASRSTRDMLLALGGRKMNDHHHVHDQTCRKMLSRGFGVACTVRNMFDVVVSWYHNQYPKNPPPFRKFIFEDILWYPDGWFSTPMFFYGLPWCSRIVRFEYLEDDLRQLLKDHGHKMPDLGHIGKSDRKDYREYYDNVTRKAVAERWSLDFQLTGYTF